MNQGGFHEAANLANAYMLPVIFVCEVNHWQCGVRYEQIYREIHARRPFGRAKAYGMPGVKVDGNDVIDVYSDYPESRFKTPAKERSNFISLLHLSDGYSLYRRY